MRSARTDVAWCGFAVGHVDPNSRVARGGRRAGARANMSSASMRRSIVVSADEVASPAEANTRTTSACAVRRSLVNIDARVNSAPWRSSNVVIALIGELSRSSAWSGPIRLRLDLDFHELTIAAGPNHQGRSPSDSATVVPPSYLKAHVLTSAKSSAHCPGWQSDHARRSRSALQAQTSSGIECAIEDLRSKKGSFLCCLCSAAFWMPSRSHCS